MKKLGGALPNLRARRVGDGLPPVTGRVRDVGTPPKRARPADFGAGSFIDTYRKMSTRGINFLDKWLAEHLPNAI
ncbi:MAG: DUF768 domain-containing protein, partial [Mesorhizobium sp.]